MSNDLHNYPTPSVTVDCVVFGYDGTDLSVLLIQRKEAPFESMWTIPGGFLWMEETFETTANRILATKAGLQGIFLEQLYTFGAIDRDPRKRVLSVAYFALVNPSNYQVVAGDAAHEAKWFPLSELPALGFDHQEVIQVAQQRLQAKVIYQPIGFELLDEQFTLTELQHLYETILEQSIDKRNFRKKILETGALKNTGLKRTGVKNRAPELYEFNKEAYLGKVGFELPIFNPYRI